MFVKQSSQAKLKPLRTLIFFFFVLTTQPRQFAFTVQYLGTAFSGWQVQPGEPTVQGLLEETFSKVVQEPIRIIAAGRTDSGVHALGQVGHFQSTTGLSADVLLKAFNSLLPEEVSILDLQEKDGSFHANHGAKYKVYVYWILVSSKPWAFLTPWTWRLYGDYNLSAMRACLAKIEGRHNFQAFAAANGSAKTFERNLIKASVEEKSLPDFLGHFANYFKIPAEFKSLDAAPKLLALSFKGEGFLKHMIRNLAGTLVDVAWGRKSVTDFEAILASRDRRQAGRTAPARGLSLIEVGYGRDC